MTPLRAKMIRELELHRKAPKTIEAYVTGVAWWLRFRTKVTTKYRSSKLDSSVDQTLRHAHQ